MSFVVHAFCAILIVLVGALLSSGILGAGELKGALRFTFGIATLLAQAWLFAAALYLRARGTQRFDMTVAAETLVALGVFSLITGIVVAIAISPRAHIAIGSSTLRELEPLLIPFGEGLLASAVAPLLATILRQVEVLKFGLPSGSDSPEDQLSLLKGEVDKAADALARITQNAGAASKDIEAFAAAARSVAVALTGVADNVLGSKDKVPDALALIADGIDIAKSGVPDALAAAAVDIRAGGSAVSSSLSDAGGRILAGADEVSRALTRTSSSLDDFSATAASGMDTTKEMAEELSKLGAAAQATTEILVRLQQLIDSVTDFLRPEKK